MMIKPASNLMQAKRRGEVLEWLFLGIFCVLLVACFMVAYRWEVRVTNPLINAAGALIATLIAGHPIIHLMAALDKFIRRHWITSYVIEANDDVIKVIGPVSALDLGDVRSKLLAMRPNYMMVENAYERFKCTMAAVPASEAHLNARRELSAYGITI